MRLATLVIALGAAACKFSQSVAPDGSTRPGDEAGAPADTAGPEAAPAPPCTTSAAYALSHGGHTYRVLTQQATYDVQTDACARDGAHLVTIDDAGEDAFVAGAATGGWIGLDDLTTENARFSPDGTATKFAWQVPATGAYTNWNGGEPNDANDAEDCAYQDDNQDDRWNDDNCGHTKPAVCECEPDVPAHPHASCLDGPGTIVDGRKYVAMTAPATWDAARTACRAIGADLFTPSDATENGYIGKFHPLDLETDVWIGLRDATAVGTFAWDNGSPDDYTNWLAGQPVAQAATTCVTMHESTSASDQSNGKWANASCTESHPFVCECDPWSP